MKVYLEPVKVHVTGAFGFADFEGFMLMDGYPVDDRRGILAVVIDLDDDPHVVPSSSVTQVTS